MLDYFADSERTGRRRYAEFVAQGQGVRLWSEALTNQIYLADERFVRRAQTKVRLSGGSREILRAQRRRTVLPLVRYLERQGGRDEGIARAYCEGGYTQSAIAQVLGLSVSRISRVIRTVEAKGKT